jgi:hypothetical protein
MPRNGASQTQAGSPNYADASYRRNMTIAQIDIGISSPTTDWRDRDLLLHELQRRLREVRTQMALRSGRMTDLRSLLASMQASQDSHATHETSLLRSLQRWAPELIESGEASIAGSRR